MFTYPRLIATLFSIAVLSYISGCGSFIYKTYEEKPDETNDDPEPNYNLTLNEDFQNYTNYLYPGNRIENFVTFFNTFYNAKEDFQDAYDEYTKKILENYSERLDSALITPNLSQESKDKFTKAIENCSKVIQLHKSSDLLDDAVLMIGQAYYYLGDYMKAERKFSEFVSKLNSSPKYEEAILFLSKSQIRLNNPVQAIGRLEQLIKYSRDNYIKAESYRAIAEYYMNNKDYNNAIVQYKNSIRYSDNDEFKAQMQYIIAAIYSKNEPSKAANEFLKVNDYSNEYQLEYFSYYNYTKNLILSNDFSNAKASLDRIKIKYKDDPNVIPEIELLSARYKLQNKNYISAIKNFKDVIANYPQSISSSDAAYYIGLYYENNLNDYLNAYRYYRLSAEQNLLGHNKDITNQKISIYKRYFDLRSAITGSVINTDYDTSIINLTKRSINKGTENEPIREPGNETGKEKGKGSGFSSKNNDDDSVAIRAQAKANSMFELAELFRYELGNTDSAEYYLINAYENSFDSDFKSKALFALANLYTNSGLNSKANEALSRIIELYPTSIAANESRKILGMPVTEEEQSDNELDKLFYSTENQFLNGKYDNSIQGFREIITSFPGSKYTEKSFYAIGWIFENIYSKPDSAYYYYMKLMEINPMSSYGPLISEKIAEYQNQINPDTNKINNQENIENESKQKESELNIENQKTEESKTPIEDETNGNKTDPVIIPEDNPIKQ